MKKLVFTIRKSFISKNNVYYKIIRNLGQGGNGSAYLVQCTSGANLGNFFVAKFMLWVSDEQRKKRFNQEAEMLLKYPHTSIISYFDYGIFFDIPFIITSYLPRTLRKEIEKGISVHRSLLYSCQLLSGLNHIHRNKIIHRDIKPENIFVHETQAFLGDFGIATTVSQESYIEKNKIDVSNGYPIMPKRYRTPELVSYAQHGGTIDKKSDVFQMGLVLTEMFTGVNVQEYSEDIIAPIILKIMPDIPSVRFGQDIQRHLQGMLELETKKRKSSEYYLKWFVSIYNEYIKIALELDSAFI